MRRKKMSRKSSKKNFRNAASKVHKKNAIGKPMRGGIRL